MMQDILDVSAEEMRREVYGYYQKIYKIKLREDLPIHFIQDLYLKKKKLFGEAPKYFRLNDEKCKSSDSDKEAPLELPRMLE